MEENSFKIIDTLFCPKISHLRHDTVLTQSGMKEREKKRWFNITNGFFLKRIKNRLPSVKGHSKI